MYQRSRLGNGLRIITSDLPHARSVSVTFFLRVGSRHESDSVQGISHFIEHMLFKGTEKRPTPKLISEAIEGIGGYFNAEAGKELTVYWDKVADRHWGTAIEVLADLLRHSRFDPDEVEKERRVIVEELGMLGDSPGDWVHVLADEAMWGAAPLGRDVAGTRDSVLKIARDDLLEWMHTRYVPSNLVVSVAGPLEHAAVQSMVEQLLGDWQGAESRPGEPANEGPVSRIVLKSKKTEQAHFCLALPSLSYLHPDRYALDLLNIVLGEGMSSRLFLEIRERHGLAYDVHSYTNQYVDAGSLVIYAGVDPSRIDEAVRACLGELGRLLDPVPEDELARAKEFWKGRMLLRLEDSRSIASWLGAQEVLLDRIETVDDVIAQVDRIEAADVQRLAHTLFASDKLCLSVIGPYRSEDRFLKLLHF